MNSTLGLALSMLKKQRRGSALLLSTVILSSVFLVCMCIVGASSVYTVEESRKDLYGSHKAAIWGVAEEEQNLEDFLERFPVWNAHGVAESYAAFEGIDGRSHLLGNLDESALELLRVELVSGRMPQTENEAVFEESMARQLGLDSINVGDSVTLELTDALGERYNAAFTVCGIIKNYSAVKNNTLDPGANNAFYPSVLVSSRDLPDVLTLHLLDSDVEDFHVLGPCLPPSEDGEFNTDAYPGGYSSSGFYVSEEVGLTFSALGLLGGIILVCTATVTLNGFLMSVDRRKQQMSLMRCIGATKRQAKKVVFCEAMILLILGIPAGLALG
ncbi:MAG: ABC transporter permease, partial [Clostridia bacterium]|nr:ABC transporter permease [Clostridia bacterium]